ncbi:MAG: DUF805 domain-containing protein [Clostridium sp.]|nr:DUF805 domain-containing protein [Clostridium sp.]
MTRVPYIIWSIILFVITLVGYLILKDNANGAKEVGSCIYLVGVIGVIVINVKRFHYRGKSGWNVLWFFIPFVYPIYTIYNCIKDD